MHTSPYFTHLLFYPVGADLTTETLSPLAGMLSYPFQGAGLVFSFNILLFLNFTLSGFFMFLLADHIIKNKYGAFIAGIIFTFSPFHMAHSLFGHTNWIGIEFLPLFILFFLLMIERDNKILPIIGTSISFVLLTFFGDPEQGILAAVFSVFLLLFMLVTPKNRKNIIKLKFFLSIVATLILIAAIGFPFFAPIAHSILSGGAIRRANSMSDVQHSMIWSSPLLSFLLPSPNNIFFKPITGSYIQIYNVDGVERIAYLGWVAIALAAIGIIWDIRKNRFKNTWIWIAIGVIFAWFAIGPYLQIGTLTLNSTATGIPGIYLIYRIIPILSLVREPGRFNLIVTLCIAILGAFGAVKVIESADRNGTGKTRRSALYLTLLITTLILIDYTGIPFGGSYLSSYFQKISMPSPYHNLAKFNGNFSVMFLPILSSYTNRPNLYTGESMYYQTAFAKPIVGGYIGRENSTQEYSRLNIPLSVAAASLQAGGLFAYASPINENYTNLTIFFLYKYKVKLISVMNQAYTPTDLGILNNYLNMVFGKPAYTANSTSIWLVNGTIQKNEGRSVIAYISEGNWSIGCQALGPIYCNSTLNTFWYGPNLRAVNVSVPAGMTNITMSFSTVSLNKNVTLYLFLTSDKNELGAAKLSHTPATYKLNLTLSPGIHTFFFVAENTTNPTVNQYYDFGLKNITFRPR